MKHSIAKILWALFFPLYAYAAFVINDSIHRNGRQYFDRRSIYDKYRVVNDIYRRKNNNKDVTMTTTVLLRMGQKVNIRIVGRKSSEPWLEEGVQMYEKRLRPSNLKVKTTWHKDDAALMKGYETDRKKNHKIVCLDPKGTQQCSEQFSEKLYQWLNEGGSRLSFIIGGAEGLPKDLKYPPSLNTNNNNNKKSNNKQLSTPIMISQSSLTLTHQFSRLLLLEQIYRATEIRKGSGYHK